MTMTTRPITHDDLARARRDSRPPMPKVSTILGTIMLLVTLGTMVWGMATLVSSKADKDSVHKIEMTVEVIKTRQQLFIEAVRPHLLKGE